MQDPKTILPASVLVSLYKDTLVLPDGEKKIAPPPEASNHKDKIIDDMEMQLYNMWFDNFGSMDVAGILWLTTDVQTCVERIKIRGRPGEENISQEYLENLDEAHHEWLDLHVNVERITSDISQEELSVRLQKYITRS
jgi:deoxyadenosine/deoxycytidine kinase